MLTYRLRVLRIDINVELSKLVRSNHRDVAMAWFMIWLAPLRKPLRRKQKPAIASTSAVPLNDHPGISSCGGSDKHLRYPRLSFAANLEELLQEITSGIAFVYTRLSTFELLLCSLHFSSGCLALFASTLKLRTLL